MHEVMPDAMACLAASAALAVSDIPIKEIISEVRVARVDGEFIVNPDRAWIRQKRIWNLSLLLLIKTWWWWKVKHRNAVKLIWWKLLEIAHDAIRIQIKAQEELAWYGWCER